MTFTTVSQGYQFDRLALMYFGDTEVWRTSTAEPLPPPGVQWKYVKDMTEYLYLWNSPQKLIFDLGNILNAKYDGYFNTTLTATFFMENTQTGRGSPADLIIPLSTGKGSLDKASHFTVPAETAINTISFPRNANRAVITISATGQADEEFWWGNVLQSKIDTFKQTTGSIPGMSPFREIQVLIDGLLASVVWPFPVIFTGGVIPSLHRPIVGLQAFNLREHEIDITPWLPLLCDGNKHTFALRVVGVEDDGKHSAKLTESVGNSCIDVERGLSVMGFIKSQNRTGEVFWTQALSYSNKAHHSGFGYNQTNDILISGADSMAGPDINYKASYEYPLYCDTISNVDRTLGSLTVLSRLTEGFKLKVEGGCVFSTGLEAFNNHPSAEVARFSGSHLETSRNGTATFTQNSDGSYSLGSGITNQVFSFGGHNDTSQKELYFRNVTVVGEAILSDTERQVGAVTINRPPAEENLEAREQHVRVFSQIPASLIGPRAFMGRYLNGSLLLTRGKILEY